MAAVTICSDFTDNLSWHCCLLTAKEKVPEYTFLSPVKTWLPVFPVKQECPTAWLTFERTLKKLCQHLNFPWNTSSPMGSKYVLTKEISHVFIPPLLIHLLLLWEIGWGGAGLKNQKGQIPCLVKASLFFYLQVPKWIMEDGSCESPPCETD